MLQLTKGAYRATCEGLGAVDAVQGGAVLVSAWREPAAATLALPAMPAPLTALQGATGTIGSLVPGLTLGLGLVDVGVGLWTALQVRRVRREVGAVAAQVGQVQLELQAGFARMEESLAWQSHQLGILLGGQEVLAGRMDRVLLELRAGFDRLAARLDSDEERRVNEEYHEKVALVVSRYRRLADTLLAQQQPTPGAVGRLVDAAEKLEVWVKQRLPRRPPGDPARLPYLVAQALACRAAADGRAMESGIAVHDRDIERVMETIREEARALCDGRSLWWIGVRVPHLLAQYACLYRGLAAGNGLALAQAQAGGPPAVLEAGGWDDGLAPLRALYQAPAVAEPAVVALGSLSDLAWYVDWRGLDPDRADLDGVRELDLCEVARSFGAPGRPARVDAQVVEAMLAMALPAFKHQVQARLMMAFEWPVPPGIAGDGGGDPVLGEDGPGIGDGQALEEVPARGTEVSVPEEAPAVAVHQGEVLPAESEVPDAPSPQVYGLARLGEGEATITGRVCVLVRAQHPEGGHALVTLHLCERGLVLECEPGITVHTYSDRKRPAFEGAPRFIPLPVKKCAFLGGLPRAGGLVSLDASLSVPLPPLTPDERISLASSILAPYGGLAGMDALAFLATKAGAAMYEAVGRLPDDERPLLVLPAKDGVQALLSERSYRFLLPGMIFDSKFAGRHDSLVTTLFKTGNIRSGMTALNSSPAGLALVAALVALGAKIELA
ncbi:MAG: hypothetical protein ABIO70_02155 [Pseudomonadota bacterium]